jgi:sulfur carrier protein
MILSINGVTEDHPDGVTLAELVERRMISDRGVAAAVDGAVAPRSTWPTVVLRAGQSVELLTAVQGG